MSKRLSSKLAIPAQCVGKLNCLISCRTTRPTSLDNSCPFRCLELTRLKACLVLNLTSGFASNSAIARLIFLGVWSNMCCDPRSMFSPACGIWIEPPHTPWRTLTIGGDDIWAEPFNLFCRGLLSHDSDASSRETVWALVEPSHAPWRTLTIGDDDVWAEPSQIF